MALCADSYYSCQPMYSTLGFVNLCMADFGGHASGTNQPVGFPGLSSRYTPVVQTDGRP